VSGFSNLYPPLPSRGAASGLPDVCLSRRRAPGCQQRQQRANIGPYQLKKVVILPTFRLIPATWEMRRPLGGRVSTGRTFSPVKQPDNAPLELALPDLLTIGEEWPDALSPLRDS